MATSEDIVSVFKKPKGIFAFSPTFHDKARLGLFFWHYMCQSHLAYLFT